MIVGAIIFGIIATACAACAIFSFSHKIRLLSNPWLFMSKDEREKELAKVDVTAEYRQQGIIFIGMVFIFGYLAADMFFGLPSYALWLVIGLVVVYAIGSSAKFVDREK